MLQTEYEFTLPKGYVDRDGTLHRHGVMRLATGADEILPLRDSRVRANPAYLIFILLARVIVRLGSLETITPKTIEEMFVADLNFLQDLYNRINGVGESAGAADTGNGAHSDAGEVLALGESYATPRMSSAGR